MEEGSFVDSKGRKLKTFTWTPSQTPRGLVFISHGYAERLVPYYSALAEAGREAGLLVFGHDHAGHGESEGERVLVADMAELTGPLVQHCRDKMEQHPSLPLFLVAHSMGGLIALLASLEPGMPRLAGLVLMGPLVKPDPASASRLQIFLAKVASKILPRVEIGGLDTDLVTSCPEGRAMIAADPLHHHGGVKALTGHVLLQAMGQLEQRFSDIQTPYLLILGADDKICNVEASKEFHKMSGSDDKTFKTIEGGYHHLFIETEPIRTQTFAETWDWIVKRL